MRMAYGQRVPRTFLKGWDRIASLGGGAALGLLVTSCGTGSSSIVLPSHTTINLGNTVDQRSARNSSSSYIYVADVLGRVDVFLRSDPSKGIVDRITKGVSYPDGIFADQAGTLYVTSGGGNGHDKVLVFPKGSHQAVRTYTGIFSATDVVAGSDGTVYVADYDDSRVIEFAPGTTKRLRVLHPGGHPTAVTLDAHNNLYVGYNVRGGYSGQVRLYRPNATSGVTVLPPNLVYLIEGIGLDDQGALLVANQGHGVIDIFTGKNQPPSRVIRTGQQLPYRFAFGRRENRIYVTSPYISGIRRNSPSGPKKANTVVELSYPSGQPLLTWREQSWVPSGVAVIPRAPF